MKKKLYILVIVLVLIIFMAFYIFKTNVKDNSEKKLNVETVNNIEENIKKIKEETNESKEIQQGNIEKRNLNLDIRRNKENKKEILGVEKINKKDEEEKYYDEEYKIGVRDRKKQNIFLKLKNPKGILDELKDNDFMDSSVINAQIIEEMTKDEKYDEKILDIIKNDKKLEMLKILEFFLEKNKEEEAKKIVDLLFKKRYPLFKQYMYKSFNEEYRQINSFLIVKYSSRYGFSVDKNYNDRYIGRIIRNNYMGMRYIDGKEREQLIWNMRRNHITFKNLSRTYNDLRRRDIVDIEKTYLYDDSYENLSFLLKYLGNEEPIYDRFIEQLYYNRKLNIWKRIEIGTISYKYYLNAKTENKKRENSKEVIEFILKSYTNEELKRKYFKELSDKSYDSIINDKEIVHLLIANVLNNQEAKEFMKKTPIKFDIEEINNNKLYKWKLIDYVLDNEWSKENIKWLLINLEKRDFYYSFFEKMKGKWKELDRETLFTNRIIDIIENEPTYPSISKTVIEILEAMIIKDGATKITKELLRKYYLTKEIADITKENKVKLKEDTKGIAKALVDKGVAVMIDENTIIATEKLNW